MTQPTVAMLVRGNVAHDNRVRREAETVARLGYRVVVLADSSTGVPAADGGVRYEALAKPNKGRKRQRERIRRRGAAYVAAKQRGGLAFLIAGAQLAVATAWLPVVHRAHEIKMWFRRQGVRGYRMRFRGASAKRIAFWKMARLPLEQLRPDIVHAHDLKTLYAGARYASIAQVPLVYDAHEFEVYSLPVKTRRTRVGAWLFERYGARRAAAVITVSDEIADELARMHGITRPRVVFNTPPGGLRERVVESLRDRLAVAPGDRILVYVGGVHPARGTTHLVEALAALRPEYHVAIVGPRREDLDAPLLEVAAKLGAERRLHLVSPVAGDDVPAFLASADVSVLPGLDVCRSYELSMPNKLFESIQAGLPLAVSDRWRAAAHFVQEHEIGTVFDVYDPSSIAAAVEAVVETTPAGIADRERLRKLQDAYSWEAQEKVISALYASLPEPATTVG